MTRFIPGCPIRAALAGLFVAALLAAPAAFAQPFVVDDAGIAAPGACEFVGWADPEQAWTVAACTPLARTEFTVELGVLREPYGDHTHTELELIAETKVQLLPDDPGQLGLAVVAGVALHPGQDDLFEEAYAFVPITLLARSERVALHVYGGAARAFEDGALRGLYGARLDGQLVGELGAYAEVYGEGPDVGYQVVLRAGAVPDRVEVFAGVGGSLRGEAAASGPIIGLVWMTPRFFRPLRF